MENISQQELNRRATLGKIVAALSVIWWVAAIGGIILVIEMNK